MKKRFRKAVFIVTYRRINNNILYLLLKRKLHWTGWEFPKGGVENFELKKRAVKRELNEETGQIPVKITKFKEKGKYKYHNMLDDRRGFIGQTYRLYSAEIKNKKVILDKKEHSSYKWLPYKKALKQLTYLNQRKCLSIVNNYLLNNN